MSFNLTLSDLMILATPLVSVIVWLIRLEGRHNTSETKIVEAKSAADKAVNEFRAMVTEHYATKQDIAIVRGAIDSLAPQLADTKASVTRIENKMDAFLVAALKHPQTGG